MPLLKLTILPFESDEKATQMGPAAGPPFIVQFNPETYTDTTEIKYADDAAQGKSEPEAKYQSVSPKKYTFELMLDGTGATPAPLPIGALDAIAPSSGLSVLAQLELFKLTVGFKGSIHRPRFLVLLWGRLVATTVLETYSINYKMFTPEGLPLRATLSATFRTHTPKNLGALLQNLASPDVDHVHQVLEGEHLTEIVNTVYNDPAYYLAVAAANGLDTVRTVAPGSALRLPPVR